MRRTHAVVALTVLAGCYAASDRYIVSNAPPAVAILLPAEDALFEEDEGIVFQGRVSDNQPVDTLLIQWESSIDGPLDFFDVPDPDGYLELATAGLSIGDHVITLRATDDDEDQGEARVTIHVEGVPDDPTIEVLQPQNNGQGLEGFPYEFMVRVDDHQTAAQDLLVDVTADPGGPLCIMVPNGNGIATCSEELANGTYLLTFRVTDLDGFTASRNVVFEMVAEGDYDGDGDGYTPNDGDCNDNLANVFPGAPEVCDGLDNDCIPETTIDVGTDCYDDDADGFCESPPCINAAGHLSDCNDAKNWVYPGAPELLNGTDDDCDGLSDDGTVKWDDDGDGFCESPPCLNASGTASDCDDTNNQVRPSVTGAVWQESCATAYDDNCNTQTNEQNALGATKFYRDQDGDTFYATGSVNDYQFWCVGQSPYSATKPNDCYDQNALAHPYFSGTQQVPGGLYYGSPRGSDNSYDYDCINSQEKRYPSQTSCHFSNFSCNGGGAGWISGSPACGATAPWQDDCSFDITTAIIGCGICVFANDPVDCLASNCPDSLTCDSVPGSQQQTCR